MVPVVVMQHPQIGSHSGMQGIKEFQQPVQATLQKRRGMLMVVIPGADLRFRDNHRKEITAQHIGVGHGEVQDKVQRTECENTRHREPVLGVLEDFESKSHFPCPLNPFAVNIGTGVRNLPVRASRRQGWERFRNSA